jgi:hypothetical protein
MQYGLLIGVTTPGSKKNWPKHIYVLWLYKYFFVTEDVDIEGYLLFNKEWNGNLDTNFIDYVKTYVLITDG